MSESLLDGKLISVDELEEALKKLDFLIKEPQKKENTIQEQQIQSQLSQPFKLQDASIEEKSVINDIQKLTHEIVDMANFQQYANQILDEKIPRLYKQEIREKIESSVNRLYTDSQKKQMRMQEIRIQQIEKQQKELKSQRKRHLNSTSQQILEKLSIKPIQDRYKDIQEAKKSKLLEQQYQKQLQQQKENQQYIEKLQKEKQKQQQENQKFQHKYKKINFKAVQGFNFFYYKVSDWWNKKNQNQNDLIIQKAQKETEDCPFKPLINSKSQKICDKKYSQLKGENRIVVLHELAHNKKLKEIEKLERNFSYSPALNSRSRRLVNRSRSTSQTKPLMTQSQFLQAKDQSPSNTTDLSQNQSALRLSTFDADERNMYRKYLKDQFHIYSKQIKSSDLLQENKKQISTVVTFDKSIYEDMVSQPNQINYPPPDTDKKEVKHYKYQAVFDDLVNKKNQKSALYHPITDRILVNKRERLFNTSSYKKKTMNQPNRTFNNISPIHHRTSPQLIANDQYNAVQEIQYSPKMNFLLDLIQTKGHKYNQKHN